MRKATLIEQISKVTGVPKVDVLVALESFLQSVKQTLGRGENVYLRGFASFIIKKRARKVGRNIKRNHAVLIPEHFVPAFRPALEFVSLIKNLTTDDKRGI